MSSLRRMRPMNRRAFLARMAALSGAAYTARLWFPGSDEAWAQTNDTVTNPAGTTLERSIVTTGEGPYFSLAYGPGWPIKVRTALAQPTRGRENRRVALASYLHLTDFQLVDAQSPARVEFVDRSSDPPSGFVPFGPAQRPEEALVSHTVEAVIRQSNAVRAGPVTGRGFDATVCTGDNIDNKQANELDWYLTLMDGGDAEANSGAGDTFEGVQSFDASEYYDPHYWHPEELDDPRAPDNYKAFYGYPDYPGLLAAAIQPFGASGIGTPWYTAYGNHDALVQGNEQANPAYEAIATGGTKVLAPPPGYTPGDFYRGLTRGDPQALTAFNAAPARPVTPDDNRRFISGEEYIRAHLESPTAPTGHGFTQDNLDPVTLYYSFEMVEGIRGITLDTTSPRSSQGSIGQTQLDWLEQELREVHSRYFDGSGSEATTDNDDRLVVIISHHAADSMQPIQGPDQQGNVEQRFGGGAVEDLLHRFPNVILWFNGHTHQNRVRPRPDPQGRTGGYWDVTTAAQVDPPQQARTYEIVDNRDGTLSIFTTILDHAGPPRTSPGDYDVLGLAAISREATYNDYQTSVQGMLGTPDDLNTELLVDAPFDLTPAAPPTAPPTSPGRPPSEPPGGTAGDGTGPLPATGAGAGLAGLGVAALGGAIALRRRDRSSDPDE